jgi:hypothetical protein
MTTINTTNTSKNAVEIRTELKANGTNIEYICIDGVKCGILGSVNAADREAALKVLNDAYTASNGNIMEMMMKLTTVATIEEKEIEPDEMVEVCGEQIMLSYYHAKAYTMDGEEIANCNDLPPMPTPALKALLVARAEIALN